MKIIKETSEFGGSIHQPLGFHRKPKQFPCQMMADDEDLGARHCCFSPLQWLISTYLLRSTSFLAMKPAELCPFSWSPLLNHPPIKIASYFHSCVGETLCCLESAQRPGGSFRCARIEPAGGSHNPFSSVEQMGTGQLVAGSLKSFKYCLKSEKPWPKMTQMHPNRCFFASEPL
jgi:hypothetical protein